MTKDRNNRIEIIFNNLQSIKRSYYRDGGFSGEQFGVTMAQVSVLMLLDCEGKRNMTELSEELGISKGAVTQLIDGLVDLRLVGREQNDKDKRIVHATLTRRGRGHLRLARRRVDEKLTKLFEMLDDRELGQVEAISTHLAEKIKEGML